MGKNTAVVSGLLALLLIGSALLVVLGGNRSASPRFSGRVADFLAVEREVPGWSHQDIPIADTPEMQKRVFELLNFDDGEFAVYSDGRRAVSMYVAYWRPGKMTPRLVAGHTPDVCWVGAGWKIQRAVVNNALSHGAQPIFAAEERDMHRAATQETVLYWHVAADRVLAGYDPAAIGSAFCELWAFGLRQRPEQFFVRISSRGPVKDWWEAEPIQVFLAKSRLLDGRRVLAR